MPVAELLPGDELLPETVKVTGLEPMLCLVY